MIRFGSKLCNVLFQNVWKYIIDYFRMVRTHIEGVKLHKNKTSVVGITLEIILLMYYI